MARPGIEPGTPDLRVRCPTDCAMRPGSYKIDLDLWDCSGRVNSYYSKISYDLVIYSHSRDGETPSYSRINTIFLSSFCESQVQHKPNFSFLGEFQ